MPPTLHACQTRGGRAILAPMNFARILVVALSCLCGAALAQGAAPQRLSLATGPGAGQPGVALEPGRGFVVSWQESAGSDASLHYAALDFAGRETARGVIARGRDWFVNWADTPGLAVLDNGDWVAFWLQRTASDAPEAYDIRLVRSRDRGRSWSAPVSPHRDGTATQHGFVALLPDGGDRVLVAWLDGRLAAELAAAPHPHGAAASHDEEAAPMTLRAAVLDRRGRVRDEALLDARTCSCCQTDAARAPGGALVVYRDRGDDEVRDISYTQRARAGRWSAPRPVHVDGWRIEGCPVNGPALAVNGPLQLAVWPTLVGQGFELRHALRDGAGAFVTRTLATDAPPSGRVDAAPWGDGFIVTWVSRARDRPGFDYALVDARGAARAGGTIAQPAARGRAAGFPRVASDGATALFVWTESDDAARDTAIGAALLRRR